MNKKLLGIVMLFSTGLSAQTTWHDAKSFRIMGRTLTEPEMEQTDSMAYTRLPWSNREEYRSELWYLGLNSAGIALRFQSDSKAVSVRWTVRNNFAMNHMAATGVRGVDLYVLEGDQWRFAGTGMPGLGKENEKVIISGMNGQTKEFLLNLPLYDGVVKLEIGIDSTACIDAPLSPLPLSEKPIVCYGTSITQGGCASRPGMAYPAIMERHLQREVINLGFSGNGRMDGVIGQLMAQIDAGVYIVDCLGNCTLEMVEELGYDFVHHLLLARPTVPLYMVDFILTPAMSFSEGERETITNRNYAWRKIYEQLCGEGFQNVFYIPSMQYGAHDNDVGADNYPPLQYVTQDAEATVDGVHLTDLGFLRFAEVLIKALRAGAH